MNVSPTFTKLNALRIAANLKPLKDWKESGAKLVQAIAKLENASPLAAHFVRSAEREEEAQQADEKEAAEQRIMNAKAKKIARAIVVKPSKSVKDLLQSTKAANMSVAEYCKQFDINPKIARAKLRKAGVKQVEGHWVATREAIEALGG